MRMNKQIPHAECSVSKDEDAKKQQASTLNERWPLLKTPGFGQKVGGENAKNDPRKDPCCAQSVLLPKRE